MAVLAWTCSAGRIVAKAREWRRPEVARRGVGVETLEKARATARRLFGSGAQGWFLVLGLGCFFCWFWAALQNPNSALQNSVPSYSLYWELVLASAALSFGAILVVAVRCGADRRKRYERRSTVGVLVAYALAGFVPRLCGLETTATAVVETLVTGVLASWMFVQWGAIMGRQGPRRLLWLSCAALVASFVLALVLYQTSYFVAVTLVSLLPFASLGVVLGRGLSGWEESALDDEPVARAAAGAADATGAGAAGAVGSSPASADAATSTAPAPKGNGAHPMSLYATLLVQGMAFGLLHLLYGTVVLEKCTDPFCVLRFLNGNMFPQVTVADFYGVMGVFGIVLAAAVVAVATGVLRLNFRKLIYVVGFPLMAIGFLILSTDTGFRTTGIASHASGVNFTAGEVVYIAGYYYTIVTTWALCSYLSQTKRHDRVRLYAWASLSLTAGQLLGYATSMLVGFERFSRGEYCTDAIFMLLLASLLMVSNDGLWRDWGGVRPTEQGSASAFKSACEIIERTYRLTPRERDVFVLLARGRNMAFVAESLCVTKDTVKTHARSLYRKLGVHSQQELIDRVEAEIEVARSQRM